MIPKKQWKEKGTNMDKRTARKVFRRDFQRTIREIDEKHGSNQRSGNQYEDEDDDYIGCPISVFARKRPIFPHEIKKHEYDIARVERDSRIIMHQCTMYADMKHMYIDTHRMSGFDRCFDENARTNEVYLKAAEPLVEHVLQGGYAACMMYGQTGSGKTYTMTGMQTLIANDFFTGPDIDDYNVTVQMVEITGSRIYDLLNNHMAVKLVEDAYGNPNFLPSNVHTVGSAEELLSTINEGNLNRATESTAVNSVSSRSHCLCIVTLHERDRNDDSDGIYGQLTLLDLSGSERNEDSFYHGQERVRETVEINTSHLALKECIRAINRKRLDPNVHIPYRRNALTRILKKCLWSASARVSVIACFSPITTDTEHSLHALEHACLMRGQGADILTTKTDVKMVDESEQPEEDIRRWDNEKVRDWMNKLQKGRFRDYSRNLKQSTDGRQLLKLSIPGLARLCNGNATDAEIIFNRIRHDQQAFAKRDKERRKRNIVRLRG